MVSKAAILRKAAKAFLTTGKRGTVCLEMGTGKTKLALDIIESLGKTDGLRKVLVLVPNTHLMNGWRTEVLKWWGTPVDTHSPNRIWVSGKPELFMTTVQTAYKWPKDMGFGMMVADEVHMMATPEYGKVFVVQKCPVVLGLTGTPDLENEKKSKFYALHCPVVFQYYDSAKDGLINRTKYIVHRYPLRDEFKVEISYGTKRFLVGERKRYEYLDKAFQKASDDMYMLGSRNHFASAKAWRTSVDKTRKQAAWNYIRAMINRKKFLLELKSSETMAKEIMDGILSEEGTKVVVFSELTSKVDAMSPNRVHSKRTAEENRTAVENFNSGKNRVLASAYSLNLGINLVGATHAVMESMVGSRTVFKQRRGRTSRLDPTMVSTMHIVIPKGTQMEVWFAKVSGGIPPEDITMLDYE